MDGRSRYARGKSPPPPEGPRRFDLNGDIALAGRIHLFEEYNRSIMAFGLDVTGGQILTLARALGISRNKAYRMCDRFDLGFRGHVVREREEEFEDTKEPEAKAERPARKGARLPLYVPKRYSSQP